MEDETESLFYLGVGPIAAMVLGMALVPLRGVTTASNFTFVFLALTIVVAEFGGRWAAVATALCSALSLDFFLTEPYLRLSIDDKHDIVAFVGLAVCGLIAAALGGRREELATLKRARKHQHLVRSVLCEWDVEGAIESQLAKALRVGRDALPVAALVVRDSQNTVVASSGPSDGLRPMPDVVLGADTLLPLDIADTEFHRRILPLPIEAGRVALRAGRRSLGWLDIWGNGGPAGAESRRTLTDLARLIALLLASSSGRPRGEHPRK